MIKKPAEVLLAASMRPALRDGDSMLRDGDSLDTSGERYPDERVVDDFVFLCMLVGNDFIPGLPSLDVADGALNLMLVTACRYSST